IEDPIARCLTGSASGAVGGQAVLLRADGEEFWVHYTAAALRGPSGQKAGAVLAFKDTTALRGMEREVNYLATFDPLTGLLNRREFERRLERALQSAREHGKRSALCYLDLDEFKVVNDVCGHGAGDELLQHVATLLQRRADDDVVLARLGGDEFGVLIEDRPLKEARRIAQDIRRTIAGARFTWHDRTFEPAVSVGLVPIGPETKDLAALMIAADAACYAAKESGRNKVHEYQPDDAALAERSGEMQWIARIHKAFEEGRFLLYHQPIQPLQESSRERLSEVVLRMRGEDGEVITPNAFIPAAERYHLVPAIDRWVVREALQALATRLPAERAFTINLSGQSLSEESFLEWVVQHLMSTRVPTERVLFEITETAAIANHARAMSFISILRGMGCRFVLDDFGTGFSTFAYLKNLPVDFLKIDGEFVRDLASSPIHQVLVGSIHQIGHAMGIQTIAEAVEDDATLQALRRMGLDYAQGFHLDLPMPL
ncbi:MAG: EAL domain-containing protein, partial [Acidobacteriota bacterium]